VPELLAPAPGFDQRLCEGFDWDDDGAPAIVLANPEWVRRNPAAAAEARRLLPDQPGHLLVATSGTSRAPEAGVRWVALSRRAVLASAAAVNAHLEAGPRDTWALALPLFHVAGLGILARAWLSQARVEDAGSGDWDPRSFRQRVEETSATLTALVPTQVFDLVAAALAGPPTLRAVVVGGGRLDPELYDRARGLRWPLLPSYGLTETASQIATASLASLDEGTCPSALPMLSHAEARADGGDVIWVRGASLLTNYVEIDSGRTVAWDPRDSDGWLRTEDLGAVRGNLIEVRGRSADTVKVLGELVWLPRVEAAAARWAGREPSLAGFRVDLAVAALPHERLGCELVLALALEGSEATAGPSPGELLASLARFESGAMLPPERIRRLALVEAIPRTPLGKCRRQALSALLDPAAPPGAS
jgi:O-succinylbenzoic acid--CoA ligase